MSGKKSGFQAVVSSPLGLSSFFPNKLVMSDPAIISYRLRPSGSVYQLSDCLRYRRLSDLYAMGLFFSVQYLLIGEDFRFVFVSKERIGFEDTQQSGGHKILANISRVLKSLIY